MVASPAAGQAHPIPLKGDRLPGCRTCADVAITRLRTVASLADEQGGQDQLDVAVLNNAAPHIRPLGLQAPSSEPAGLAGMA